MHDIQKTPFKGEDETETYPVYEHLSDLINETLCNKKDVSYYRLARTNRQFENCGVKQVKLMRQDASQSALDVKWEFEYVSIATDGDEKRRRKIVTKISKAGKMFAYFKPVKNFCVTRMLSYPVNLLRCGFSPFLRIARGTEKAELVNILVFYLRKELKQKRSFKSLFSLHVDRYNMTSQTCCKLF